MIAEAFSFIHFPILPLVKHDGESGVQLFQRNPKLCTPRDFDYSPYFQIIKYPFLDYSHHSDYRLLPWHGRGVLEGREADFYMSSQQMQQLQEERDLHDRFAEDATCAQANELETEGKPEEEPVDSENPKP